MKKLISLTLALVMLISAAFVISCGNDDVDTEQTTTTTKKTTTTRDSDAIQPPEEIPQPTEPVKIGTADELVEFIKHINDWDYDAKTDAVLTADIDMTGITDTTGWEPMYVFSGVFDGAGHTIKNLNWNFVMENGGATDMPTATEEGTYIITNINGANGDNCFADAGIALLAVSLDGGEIKNLKLADCSVNIECSYNKNYNTLVAGLVASMNNAKISSCELTNVNVTVPAEVNYNQGRQGYSALVAARAMGNSVITDCKVSGTVDTTANVKFNAAPILGYYEGTEGEGSIEILSCTSTAIINVCPAHELDESVLMYKNGTDLLGGRTGELYVDSPIEVKTTAD